MTRCSHYGDAGESPSRSGRCVARALIGGTRCAEHQPEEQARARAAAREWVANLARQAELVGTHATSPYVAADRCGYCAGLSSALDAARGAFLAEFTLAREEAERDAGRPHAVEFLLGGEQP